ncbi:hypothetical protein NW762_014580 [Fusarium torreyae]|uniref:Uncharacterized protein n=1 Tax=Fusarium torreyae TaxID=1237075 RepID=A0A9W8RK18_9HYPO|nr:hypothetical protein NW762_014580 [Fusarium torreyae]
MPPTETLHQLGQIEGAITRHHVRLSNLKSPTEVYEEKAAEIRERIRLSWASLDSTLGPETSKIRDDIVDSGGQLRELKIEHETGVQDEKEVYDKAVQEIADTLCSELLDLIGPTKITSYLQKASNEVKKLVVLDLDVEQSPFSSTIICAGNKRKTASPKTPKTKLMKLSHVERNDHDSTRIKPHPSSSDARSSRRRTRPSHRRHGDNGSAFDEDFEGVTEPDAGNVYLAFWERSKDWFAVFLLPMEDLPSVGIPGSIESLGLADALPKCYCNKRGSVTWAEGYGDGEFLVAEREFPVMYFDGQDFPTKSDVGWVSARDLRPFDANSNNSLIPHIKSVRKFLETREQADLSKSNVEEPKTEVPGTADQLSTGVTRSSYQIQKSLPNQEREHFETPPVTQADSPSMDCEAIPCNDSQLQPLASFHNRQEQQDQLDTKSDSAAPHESDRINEHVGSSESRNIAHLNTTKSQPKPNSLELPEVLEARKGFRDIIWAPVVTPRDSRFTLPALDQHDTLEAHSTGADSPSLSSPKTLLPVPVLSASQKVQQWQLTQYDAGYSPRDRLNSDDSISRADAEQQRQHDNDIVKRGNFNSYAIADMQKKLLLDPQFLGLPLDHYRSVLSFSKKQKVSSHT